MSQGQRSSSRINKGVQPDRFGFSSAPETPSKGKKQAEAGSVTAHNDPEIENLQKKYSEQCELIEDCEKQKSKAEEYLKQFEGKEESEIPAEHLEDWKKARRDLHNAATISDSACKRKEDTLNSLKRKMDLFRDQTEDPNLAGAASLEIQRFAKTTRPYNYRSREPSIASSRVSLQQADISKNKKLLELEKQFEEKFRKVVEDIESLEMKIIEESDPAQAEKLEKKLKLYQGQQERFEKNLDKDREFIIHEYELQLKEIEIEKEDEQRLSPTDFDNLDISEKQNRVPLFEKEPEKKFESFQQRPVAPQRRETFTGYQPSQPALAYFHSPVHQRNQQVMGNQYGNSFPQQTYGAPMYPQFMPMQSSYGSDRRLPEFDGNPAKWIAFKSAFDRTCQKYHFDAGENLARIDFAIKGRARETIQHFLINPANVPIIMTVLERNFGSPEIVLEFLVKKAQCSAKVELNKPQTIIDFGILIQSLVVNIEASGELDYLKNPTLLKELEGKLPGAIKDQWLNFVFEDPRRKFELKGFSNFMEFQCRKARRLVVPEMATSENKAKKKEKGSVNSTVEESTQKSGKNGCSICGKANHKAATCFKFKNMTVDERWETVKDKENPLCISCLGKNHIKSKCKFKEVCGENGCKMKHHRLLHSASGGRQKWNKGDQQDTQDDDEKVSAEKKESPGKSEEKVTAVSVNVAASASLPIIPVIVSGPKGFRRVYALLDSGSTCTIMEDEVANSIGATGKETPFTVTVFGNKTRTEASKTVELEISGSFPNAPTFHVKNIRTVKKLGIPGISVDVQKLKEKYSHLKQVRMKSCKLATPQVIIGFDNSTLLAARKILESKNKGSPSAFRCLLGWYVCESKESADGFYFIMEDLHGMVKDHFSLENFGVLPTRNCGRSQEDKAALKLMESNTKKLSGNRWETCLLWRNEDCVLPESKSMAIRRLATMEKKMDADPDFAKLVTETFADYIKKGFLIPTDNTRKVNNGKQWFLPWFFAFHPSKRPRMVFDAAAKSNGKSFNDFILKGPDYLELLPGVLMRFRKYLVAMTADIKEMFHQVSLREQDRCSQTILFRGMNREGAPKEYEMSVLFFGSASSPSSAIFVKTKNALEYQQQHPEIVEKSIKDCYMDDFLSGADSENEAVALQKIMTWIQAQGGFPVLKWNSSSEQVIEKIPEELRVKSRTEVQLSQKSDVEYEKTLGLLWDPLRDEFLFKFSPKAHHKEIFEQKKVPTKREVTSILMSLFDPLGFIAPLKIQGLIILQDIWRSGISWDDGIDSELCSKWNDWTTKVNNIDQLRVRRKFCEVPLREAEDIQLHVFVDASQEAYAAVAYLRVQTRGSFQVSFIFGKSRVKPLKKITVPKMELQAAVLGTRMAATIKNELADVKVSKTFFWSDSRTVLCWIRSSSGRFNTFVSNRIGEILERTNVTDWKWVPTSSNSADAGTRSANLFLETWLKGPAFLFETEDYWPVERFEQKEQIDTVNTGIIVENYQGEDFSEVLPDVSRFSNWFRLIRTTARVFLAVRIMRKKEPFFITVADLNKAKLMWLRKAQSESFNEELLSMRKTQQVSSKSKIHSLSPKLNADGVIVLEGRLGKAKVSENVRKPPILHPNHPYTKLLVKWFHVTGGHYGQERIINEIRSYVWVMYCRSAVRKCKAECLICKRNAVVPISPEMGQLPVGRVQGSRSVFYNCGLDYFGPVLVKNKRSLEKRWGVIFTCLATRAVHLDIAQSLSTSDMISTLIRFINLRGKPAHIWSDNGSNFVGAEREIRERISNWKVNELHNALQVREISWHFLPPAAPHMGGCYERLIKDVKRLLRNFLTERHPPEDTLRTYLAEVTGILNSRPITVASPDADDLRCLTPNDLLNIPCVVGGSITGEFSAADRFKKSWEQSQYFAKMFWDRWSKEYLPWLVKRSKWHAKSKPLEVGDVVVVLEDNAERNAWKTGRITEVYPSKDGQVRSVEVKIARVDPDDPQKKVHYSYLKRPTVKICPLSITKENLGESFERENVAE